MGELLIGVLLGPSLIGILHLPFINNETLGTTISELSRTIFTIIHDDLVEQLVVTG